MAGMLPIPAATTMPPAQSPATRRPRPALVTNVPAALSHQRDFAKAFVGLLGHPAIGDTFHITSDEWLSWNEIFRIVAHAVRVEANLVHVPPDAIAAADPKWGAGLPGNEGHWMISTTPRFVGGPPFRGGHPVTTPGSWRSHCARRGSRRSPATNSRLSSSPATKKKIARSPSAAH